VYQYVNPERVQLIITNFGDEVVQEVTIGFKAAPQGWICSGNPQEYDGVKKFAVQIPARDAQTIEGDFSGRATTFCIVGARSAGRVVDLQPTAPGAQARVDAIRILEFGIYRATDLGPMKTDTAVEVHALNNITLVQVTDVIPARLGVQFGVKYVVEGSPVGSPIDVILGIRYPRRGVINAQGGKMLQSEHKWSVQIGKPRWRVFTFHREGEVVPGEWVMEFSYQGRKLAEKRFRVETE
jgi:hypothetical protein